MARALDHREWRASTRVTRHLGALRASRSGARLVFGARCASRVERASRNCGDRTPVIAIGAQRRSAYGVTTPVEGRRTPYAIRRALSAVTGVDQRDRPDRAS